VHRPNESAHDPSPGLTSTESTVLLTLKVAADAEVAKAIRHTTAINRPGLHTTLRLADRRKAESEADRFMSFSLVNRERNCPFGIPYRLSKIENGVPDAAQ
jgi:hypothetical protein